MRRLLCSLILPVVVALAAAPAKTPPASAAKPAPANDAAIEAAIKTKLARSKIGANHFTIRVQNGVAYWDGKTEVVQHKGAATRMAKSAGARRVVNNIQISAAGRAKARAHLDRARRTAHTSRGEDRGESRGAPRAAIIRR